MKLGNRIERIKVSDDRDRFRGFKLRRVGYCGEVHEAFAVRMNHAKVNLDRVIEACPGCNNARIAQSQPASAS